MSVLAILDAIEQYMKIRKELESPAAAACDDWDCGLANELSGYYSPQQSDRLGAAKSALKKALDDYIDQRIRTLINLGR